MKKKKLRQERTHSHIYLSPPNEHKKRPFSADDEGVRVEEALEIFLLRDDGYMLRVNKLFRKICLACICFLSESFLVIHSLLFGGDKWCFLVDRRKEEVRKREEHESSIKSCDSDKLKLDSKWKIVIRKSL